MKEKQLMKDKKRDPSPNHDPVDGSWYNCLTQKYFPPQSKRGKFKRRSK